MSKKYFYLSILLVFLVSIKLKAQIHNFINYNVGEGIEQSDILCVNQSQNGYLLYGSNGGGLGYYDGYNFKSIKEKNGLANNVVFSIAVDKDKKVWVATNGGVSNLTPNLNKIVNTYSKEIAFYCSYYSVSHDKVYFGSAGGVYFFNGDSLEKYSSANEALNSAFINAIYTDSKKNLWIGTRQKGVFKITTENKIVQFLEADGLPSNYTKSIIETKNKIWVGTLNGLALIENDTISNFEIANTGSANLTITASTIYNGELVFGALNEHLYFVNPVNNSYKVVNKENGFNYKKVWSLYTDIEGNLWFGTIGQGLTKFNSTFTYFNDRNGLLSSYINTIFEDKNNVWFGYKGKGIDIVSNNKIEKSFSSNDLGGGSVNRIAKIDRNIYIGRNLGLSIYDGQNIKNIDFPNKQENTVLAIYKHQGTIFLGTLFGLFKLQEDSLAFVKGSPKEFMSDIIAYDKNLFIASKEGYYIYNGQHFKLIGENEGLNVGRVRSFVIDENKNLWIATNEGLFVKQQEKHLKIDEEKGLSSDNIYFLKIDDSQNLWVGTNKGVDRLKIDLYLKEGKIKVRNYSKAEGMKGVECNLNSVCLTEKGKLWFGTIDGAYLYNEKADELNSIPPKITLNNIKMNFNDVNWEDYSKEIDFKTGLPKTLELNHTNNNFIFEYVGVSLKNPEKVQYQYQLQGLDEDWLPVTKDRKAVYTALSPGSYTFKLRAKNNDDVWVNEPTTFSFTIFPPWYQTKWFYISCALLLLLGFYLFVKIRTRNFKKTQMMLTQQVDERTKELREEKDKVEDQKKVIEVANKNITDSINYAKKIQEAILPKGNKLDKYADNVAVLYLPKDVVSGDFYWFDKLDDKLIIAAADCTGHGVPGAFMSMIGVNNLNQIILENKETNPSKILTQLNVAIKKVLRQEDVGSQSKDGMDISICVFDVKKNIVQYAGAFRPLIYIRNNELNELKGSRNPIGGNAPSDFVYELNEFEVLPGDVFYMFSDGYPDQFGGVKGKKFMNKRLKQIFIDNHKKSPDEQREILKKQFYEWMGNEEQIDDILVMCMQF